MKSQKATAWKKNRKFGDVHGGRTRPKLTDNIFRRAHSLTPPGPGDALPIVIEENPSRDFYFPLSGQETLEALTALPKKNTRHLTHLWLRRRKKSEGATPFAEFICGSGVRVIVLYPWPTDNILRFGKRRPSGRQIKLYSEWTADLFQEDGIWCLRWTNDALRHMYIKHLLYHEVGHHIDWYNRQWSNANRKQVEDFADQYAVSWSKTATDVYNHIQKNHK